MSQHSAPLHITEPDKPNVALIVLFIVGTSVIVIGVILGVMQYFDFTVRAELQQKQYGAESTLLRKLRADEQTRLSKYSWLSQKDATVRIPLERAMELTLRDWNSRPGGYVAFAPAGVPAGGLPVPPATPPATPPTTPPAH